MRVLEDFICQKVDEKIAEILANQQAAPKEPPPDMDQELTPAEAAELLGISRKTLEAWRRRGMGPAYKKYSERALRYQLKAVLDFKQQRTRK